MILIMQKLISESSLQLLIDTRDQKHVGTLCCRIDLPSYTNS